ncbi:MAG: TonB-dependent receptor plug domain-containing protein, partial [Cyclobacteriaceae bacterium]|nr:TonB-dependent receptor plug domain-containing protein [Cyclobacteriaceae bacterium]
MLSSVIVEAEQNSSSQRSLQSHVLDAKGFEDAKSNSFGDLAGQLSGVNTLQTGQNIVKPVIHGLHSNRILVINNGVRHEFQNWGTEHAPEIDPTLADQIEVVKGASTVRFGPEALGGVLLIGSHPIRLHEPVSGQLGMRGASNGRYGEANFKLEKGYERMGWRVQGSGVGQGDLHAPAYSLTNTGKREYSYGAGVRYHKGKLDLEGYYSHVYQKLGILRGAFNGNSDDLIRAMSTEPPQETRPFSYEIRQPFQQVDHQLFKLNGTLLRGGHELEVTYGWQVNNRQEYDIRKGAQNPIPSIDLRLASHSLETNWYHPQLAGVGGIVGVQWLYQDNNNLPGTNTAQFVPNYNFSKLGFFVTEGREAGAFTLEAGFRYDFQYASVRGVYQGNRYEHAYTYQNITTSLGMVHTGESVVVRSNLASAWRPPNIVEMYGFGRHQSVYEYGFLTYDTDLSNNVVTRPALVDPQDQPVKPELGIKWINSLENTHDNFQYELTGYINLIRDYIYTRPAGITTTVRGTFPYFVYHQTDALLFGGDADVRWKHSRQLESSLSASYLWAGDVRHRDYFVGMPPANVTYRGRYNRPFWKWSEFSLYVEGNYVFRAWQAPRVLSMQEIVAAQSSGTDLFATNDRTFDFLAAPAGYGLLGAGLDASLRKVRIAFRVANMTNTSYRSYMDRLRYFSDQTGRDFQLSLTYKF